MELWSPYAKVYDPLKAGSIDGTDTEPHDRAIVRALNAKYKPNRMVKGDPLATVFVGRLNPSTDEDTLFSVFEKFGKIKSLRLVRDIVTGFSKSYGFIEYEQVQCAHDAVYGGKRIEVDDFHVLVEYECERTMPGWVPRRLGGGFSGKKESGQLRFGGRDKPWKKPIVLQGSKMADSTTLRDRYGNMGENQSVRKDYYREKNSYGDRSLYRDNDRSSRDHSHGRVRGEDRDGRDREDRRDRSRSRHRDERDWSDADRYDRYRRNTADRDKRSRDGMDYRDRSKERSRDSDKRERKYRSDTKDDYRKDSKYEPSKQDKHNSSSC